MICSFLNERKIFLSKLNLANIKIFVYKYYFTLLIRLNQKKKRFIYSFVMFSHKTYKHLRWYNFLKLLFSNYLDCNKQLKYFQYATLYYFITANSLQIRINKLSLLNKTSIKKS